MANNKVVISILIFLLVCLICTTVYYKIESVNKETEIKALSKIVDIEHGKYMSAARQYKEADSLLLSSLSARKSITYITNVTNNNNEKNKVANFGAGSTDSLFSVNLISATKRYSNLLNN